MKNQLLFLIFIFHLAAHAQVSQLWGTTMLGGANSDGTIFKINGDGSGFQTVYSFTDNSGSTPRGGLCLAPNGKLYGSTNEGGGSDGAGSVYCFNPNGNIFTKIVNFNFTNGAYAWGSLTLASDGILYGNSYGGNNGYGNIFRVNPSNNSFASLYSFVQTDGSAPGGKMVQAYNGLLYGMTAYDAANGYGSIYSFNTVTEMLTNLHDFAPATGAAGYGNLCLASDSNLYGMTESGGQYGIGVLFRFNPTTDIYTKLVDFDSTNGEKPWNGLLQVSGTKLYGMTTNGGAYKWGVIFSYDFVSGIYTVEHSFDQVNDGSIPYGGLMKASDGNLYSMTHSGGADQFGTVFRFDLATDSVHVIHNFNTPDGMSPYGDLVEVPQATAIQEKNITAFSIYPNPSSDWIYITGRSTGNESVHILIADIEGQVMTEKNAPVMNNTFLSELNVQSLANGIYFLTLSGSKSVVTTKLLVLH